MIPLLCFSCLANFFANTFFISQENQFHPFYRIYSFSQENQLHPFYRIYSIFPRKSAPSFLSHIFHFPKKISSILFIAYIPFFQENQLHPFPMSNLPLYKGVFKSFPEKNDVFLEFFNIFHVISMILNEHDLLLHDISQLYLLC